MCSSKVWKESEVYVTGPNFESPTLVVRGTYDVDARLRSSEVYACDRGFNGPGRGTQSEPRGSEWTGGLESVGGDRRSNDTVGRARPVTSDLHKGHAPGADLTPLSEGRRPHHETLRTRGRGEVTPLKPRIRGEAPGPKEVETGLPHLGFPKGGQ